MTLDGQEKTVQQLFDLSGKTALVTGASGYLGGALARALAEAGVAVIVSSRSEARAQELCNALPSPGGAKHLAVAIDHMEEASIEQGFARAVQRAGRIDVLVNNGQEPNQGNLANRRLRSSRDNSPTPRDILCWRA